MLLTRKAIYYQSSNWLIVLYFVDKKRADLHGILKDNFRLLSILPPLNRFLIINLSIYLSPLFKFKDATVFKIAYI